MTAGSTSVRAFEQPLREAAAVARAMLVAAAAGRWNVDERECETADGYVISGARTLSFGELAEEAADRSPPGRPELRRSGRSRLDRPAPWKARCARQEPTAACASPATFGCPECCSHRRVWRRPADGSPISRARPISKIRGVRHIAARDGWFAVVADNGWAAEQAVKAANPKFIGNRSPAAQRTLFEDALNSRRTDRSFDRGDYGTTVRGSRPLSRHLLDRALATSRP